jgi:P-type E1-E2 ATPase
VGTIAFDKTGTLTRGTPSLSRAVPAFRHTRERLLSYAASAEYFSDHPLARAIEHAALDAGVQIAEPDEFAAAAGLGVRTRIYGHEVVVGRAAYFRELGLDALLPSIQGWPDQPGTRVHVARDRRLLGTLVFNDVVRDQARGTVDALQALGLRTIIVSGDNRRVTRSLAAQLGIYTAHANLMPADKVRVVTYLQATGGTVAFVDGGVGDRHALAAADIGIAVVRPGADFTLENAEIGLLGGDLSELPHLVSLSRWALRVMRQNLAFCLGILAAAIGFTFTGLLGPVSGALLGQLSAVAIIANSGRLAHR